MNKILSYILWAIIAFIGASCFGVLALHKGESINAVWFVIAAVCIYAIAYRFYSKYIALKVLGLDDNRATPAVVRNDGRDFVPTNKIVLFGHHFAAIAGAGPLVGPILAAQMGYLPSMIWLVVGVVLAGAVHDFVVLFLSTRRDGKSLGEMIKLELGSGVGTIAMIGILGIMMLIIAILALVVVNALAESPWGLFTIAMTIPIAIYMGIHMRFIRPGKIGEASIIGFVLLIAALYFGNNVGADPYWREVFKVSPVNLTYIMIIYGFVAAILPVWFLLAPRDYLSTFLKIGVIIIMAIAILIVQPHINMPSITQYIDGSGPVFAGKLFPFLFITIACGAISGFHALISSGTTPKMLEKESHARMVGYGSMLMESMVGVMALIAAIILTPGLYFTINVAPAGLGTMGMGGLDLINKPEAYAAAAATAANTINSWANGIFQINPQDIITFTKEVGEPSILSRTGGAPTFAIGFASIIAEMPLFNSGSIAFWYHFAILFEALFILTAVDAGTRAGRFMVQDVLGNVYKPMANISSYPMGIIATLICVIAWGYILYQGITDPQGGIKSLWTLFGVSNQLLAGIALLLGVSVLFKMGKGKVAWVVIVPVIWVLVSTMSAGVQKLLPENGEKIHDSVSHIANYQIKSRSADELIAKAQTMNDGEEKEAVLKKAASDRLIASNNLMNAILCGIFMFITIIVLLATIRVCWRAISGKAQEPPLAESPYKNASDYEGKIAAHG
ncbi:carbon starvation CstA family protein [Helicobacter sp. MIT 14-3879]|uniref:carbon starvation CstA family protein n=1 Tax=Helicobacter sp. MIT 14-3879 TaxID=2040649 RepID=UPI000E1E668D|nr:carbon starvation CstA family protein [Helicobacter sp. MIT 14-3879]RDU64832.1 carbon starvation protein A [Helicobacter sp. MIT 14-3879]